MDSLERAECPERTLSDVISTRRVSVCVSPAELTAPPIVFGFSFASHVQLSWGKTYIIIGCLSASLRTSAVAVLSKTVAKC